MLERLREEHDSQQLTLRDLRNQLGTSQEREAGLSTRLEGASAQLEQLQQERAVLVSEKERADVEGSEFRSRWEKQEELVAALREQIDRCVCVCVCVLGGANEKPEESLTYLIRPLK